MKGFSALDNPSHEGQTNTWLTPLPLIRALGTFDLDPCGFVGHETATNCLYISGLDMPWIGRFKFLRPDFTSDTNAGHGSMLLAYGTSNTTSIKESGLKGKLFE